MQRVYDSFHSKALDAGVELRLETQSFSAIFDPESMTRVLSNLLQNALRYGGPGVVTLSAALENSKLNFSVRDTGPGLPKEALNQVFERFYRADSSRTNRREGSGLGLAIAKAIVEAHGGTIKAANSPEGGAIFNTSLPQ
jgi:signal transduction histidine kinase